MARTRRSPLPSASNKRLRFWKAAGSSCFFSTCPVETCFDFPPWNGRMLIQQLRPMESDGIVRRIVHHQVPPTVEYGLTEWGQALCRALDALLKWAVARDVSELP
jgi:hypothetical protein